MTIEDEIGKLEKIMTFHDTDKAMNLKEGEHCWCRDCDDNRIRLDILYKWQADRQRLEDDKRKLAERAISAEDLESKRRKQLAEKDTEIERLKDENKRNVISTGRIIDKFIGENGKKPSLTAEDVEKER